MTNFEMVGEFMKSFGQEVKSEPEIPDKVTQALRYNLIHEELEEFWDATQDNDIVEVADAFADLLYVVYGAAHAYGIDVDTCFKEVHRSNMSKLGLDGKPIYREDGKVLKGPDFFEPDLKSVLDQQKNI